MYLFLYGAMALLTTVGFMYMHVKYYGAGVMDMSLYIVATLVGSFWFFGLPIVIWRYHKEIASVLQHRDWIDDNVPDEAEKENFREKHDDLHRQITLETARSRKAIENLRESRK